MSKRSVYPRYGENPARKALCKLNFTEVTQTSPSDTNQSSTQLKESQQREASKVTSQLVLAMLNFYIMTYKEWMNTYWHSALRPNLVASIDSAQREEVYKAFRQALDQECQQNLSEILGRDGGECGGKNISLLSEEYGITSKFLLYAKNFEMRTSQKLQVIYMLDKSYKLQGMNYGIMEHAKRRFGELVLNDQLCLAIKSEIQSSMTSSIQSVNSQEQSQSQVPLPSPPRENHFGVIYPALLAKNLRSFLGTDCYGNLNPVSLTNESLLVAIGINTKLTSTPDAIPEEVFSLNLGCIRDDAEVFQYVETIVAPLVVDWLDRIDNWTEFGLGIIKFVHELAEHLNDIDGKGLISERIAYSCDENADLLTEILSIYAIYTVVDPQKAISVGRTCRLPTTQRFRETLVEKLFDKIVETGTKLNELSESVKLLRLSEAALEFRKVFYEKDFEVFLEVIQKRLASRPIYPILHHDLVSDALSVHDARKLIQILGIAPDLPGYSIFSDNLNDWEESQYTGLIEDMAKNLLPKNIGGRELAVPNERNAYRELSNISGDMFGVLPSLLMDEAHDFNRIGSTLLLHYGNWMCTEDPSLSDVVPETLKKHMDDTDIPRLNAKGWEVKWHQGWSVLNCSIAENGSDKQSEFSCTLLQYEIIKRLIGSSKPLSSKELLSGLISDDEYSENMLVDLVAKSKGLLKTALVDDTNVYALDTSSMPNRNLANLRFSDKL